MSLDYDWSRVEDSQTLHGVNDEEHSTKEEMQEWTKTKHLCWVMLSADIGAITNSNWTKVYARVHMIQRLFGSDIWLDGKDYYYTPADIKRRIGYSTNVTTKSDTSFNKKVITELISTAEKEIKK